MKTVLKFTKWFALGLFAFVLFAALLRAWIFRPRVWLEPIAGGHAFESPVDLTSFPGEPENLIVTEKYGRIYWFNKQKPEPKLMLDLKGKIYAGGEEGLLSIAIDPENTDTAYIYYCLDKPFRNKLVRVKLRADKTIDMSTEEVLIEFEKPKTGHNAGDLQFGPDGFLWASLGEAGMYSSGNAEQLKGSLLGSIIRIDVRNTSNGKGYSIPEDNPKFVDPSVPPEVYVTGLRNPWRWNFIDERTLIVGDVGRDHYEEINVVKGGEHMGWPVLEGFECVPPENNPDCDKAGLEMPKLSFSHEVLRSVVGGMVYEGAAIPWLKGQLVFADYLRGVMSVPMSKSGLVTKKWDSDLTILHPKLPMKFGPNKGRTILPVDFYKDQNNEIYITAISGGVYKMQPISLWQALRGYLYMLTSFR